MKKVCVELYGLHNGGIEKVFENYFHNMDMTDYDITLLTHMKPDEERLQFFEERGFKHYQISSVQGHRIRLKNIIDYCTFFRRNKFDIIHSNCPENLLTLFIARLYGIRVRILHSHTDFDAIFSSKGKLVRLIYRLGFKINTHSATLLMACGRRAAETAFGKNNSTTKQVIILNNAIRTDKFKFDKNRRTYVRDKLKITTELVIGHVGRFEGKEKNQEFLIQIFSELVKMNSDSKLVLIGDGPTRKDIERLVSEYNLDGKVIFAGTTDEVVDYYLAMDLFVFPSLREGFSVTTLEAQATGLHGIISDCLSEEMNVLGNFEVMALEEGAKMWAEKCVEICNYDRKDCSKAVADAGFDIRNEAHKLNEVYSDCLS